MSAGAVEYPRAAEFMDAGLRRDDDQSLSVKPILRVTW